MPDWFADLSLVLLTYAAVALLTAWAMVAILRDGYVGDHSGSDGR